MKIKNLQYLIKIIVYIVYFDMIKINDLTYAYPGGREPAVCSVSCVIDRGEFVLLTGPSGCGKSTLAALIKGLIRGGVSGRIEIDGEETRTLSVPELAQRVGMVFQNPDLQFFGVTVSEDVAFGPENLGLPRAEIRSRVEESLRAVGISHLADRVIATLSGGERQRVAIAGALAMHPPVLILDEPTSDLDVRGRREVLETLRHLQEDGITILLIEHNLEEVVEYADRCLVMENGRLLYDDTPYRVFSCHASYLDRIGVYPPQRYAIALALNLDDPSDRSIAAALSTDTSSGPEPEEPPPVSSPAIVFDRVTTIRDGRHRVLDQISCRIGRGEFVAIIGQNGAGKSTMAGHLIGFLRATEGRVLLDDRDACNEPVATLARTVGYLFQNPDNQLFMDTVTREIGFGLANYGVADPEERIANALQKTGLEPYATRPPQSLSRGQRQRVAVASILAMKPSVLVLDEPTTGQDRGHLLRLLDDMVGLHHQGRTVLLITHDLTLVASFAERVLVLDAGRLIYDGTPSALFYRSSVLEDLGWEPPITIRLCKTLGLPPCLIPDDLVPAEE